MMMKLLSLNNARILLLSTSILAIGACSMQSSNTLDDLKLPYSKSLTFQDSQNPDGGIKAVADNLVESGQIEAAIPLYRSLAASSSTPENLYSLGETLSKLGAHEEAAKVYSKALDKDASHAPAWYGVGRSWLALGRFDEALAAFSEASNYGESRASSGRGIALAALGQTEAALSAFEYTSDTTSLSNKALVLAASGQAEAAIELLEPIIASGGSPRDRQNLSMAYLMADREGDAFRLARLDLDPASVQETFTFYRTIMSMPANQRMRALVTGTIDPEWTSSEAGNLVVVDTEDRQEAAKRIIADEPEPEPVPEPEPTPEPEPEPEPEEDRSNYELTTIPPLVEPDGWALQIGAYRTIKNLMRGWTILYRQSGDILKDIPPRRSEVDHGNNEDGPKGFYYRLNAGPLKSIAHAREICAALKERGTDCWIRPPEPTEGKLPSQDSSE
ncbi:SPOR domain-containing protein [Kordiimonas sp. SCSIO 12610]|uniref:SPOR domain-containing protein n=1 Tax=Kordiimonas sp. SCSIO 12610 TaxID=2829597 RepID=UPI00210DB413|nr:SPOR domain-containing protein [Kordiimonas sp. SCSIO 12610]UTW55581.1 tetratricopeptide repeat protein [Kordiimonas sp. SCSIO 12610]